MLNRSEVMRWDETAARHVVDAHGLTAPSAGAHAAPTVLTSAHSSAAVVDDVVDQYVSLVGEKDGAIARLAAEAAAAHDALEGERSRRERAETAIAEEQRALKRIRAAVQADRAVADKVKAQLAGAHDILAAVQVSLVEGLLDATTTTISSSSRMAAHPSAASASSSSRPSSAHSSRRSRCGARPPMPAASRDTSMASAADGASVATPRVDAVVAHIRHETVEGSAARAAALIRWQAARIDELEVAAVADAVLGPEAQGRAAIIAAWLEGAAACLGAMEASARRILESKGADAAWLSAVEVFVPASPSAPSSARSAGDLDLLVQPFAKWTMAAAVGRTLALSHTLIQQRNLARFDFASSDRSHEHTLEAAGTLLRARQDHQLTLARRAKEAALEAATVALDLEEAGGALSMAQAHNRRLQDQVADVGAKLSVARASAHRGGSTSKKNTSGSHNHSSNATTATATHGGVSSVEPPPPTVGDTDAAVRLLREKRDQERARRKELEVEVGRLERRLAGIVGRAQAMNEGWAQAERRAQAAERALATVSGRGAATAPPPSRDHDISAVDDADGDEAAAADAAAMQELAAQVRAMRGEVRAALDSSRPEEEGADVEAHPL